MIQGGPKVVLLPNNLMASNATPGQLVIHPEFLNLPHNSVIAGGQQVFPAAGIQYIQGPPGSAGQTSVLAAPLHQEPLNSEDDVSDEDPVELFETDNVVVCQYDKITRSRNKWKFHFKDGIMNLQGKDYVFSRAVGDAEW
ncbi:transcription initiation factor IIA subunit 1-like protein 1 [Sarcoptes scabiei]|uniref:Transcription initiation factor IIA subunit 1-like protein 1 n=1 Tax=Sarcoptes scabiei TaxID=52283 RepID=A0A131ZUX2_SARSC|nr:transcription initiation factor IIA subunit 1-like protein 1 [Sarcoptes scabiei]